MRRVPPYGRPDSLGRSPAQTFPDPNAPMQVSQLARFLVLAGLIVNSATAEDQPSSEPLESLPVPNGPVFDLELDGDSLFACGDFTYIGGVTGPFLVTDESSGDKVMSLPTVAGKVLAVVQHPSGGWILGGDFQTIDGLRDLVHLMPNGTLSDLGLPEVGEIRDLLVDGTTLYAAGQCYPDGDTHRLAAFAVDLVTEQLLPWHPTPGVQFSPSEIPRTLAVHGDQVYLGGNFDKTIQGRDRNNLFRVDKVSALLDTQWDPSPSGFVSALDVDGDSLYLGGGFTQVLGQARDVVAEVDLLSDALTPFAADVEGTLHAIEVIGQRLVIGGSFTAVNGQPRTCLASLERSSSNLFPWAPVVAYDSGGGLAVDALKGNGNRVLVGGQFGFLGGRRRKNVGQVDLDTGWVTGWAPNVDDAFNGNGRVFDFAVDGADIVLVGDFDLGCAVFRGGLVEIDLGLGRVTDWSPQLFAELDEPWAGSAITIEVTADAVYAGGTFARVNTQPMRALAGIDRQSGSLLQSFQPPMPLQGQPSVSTIEVVGNTLYASGQFQTTGLSYRDSCALDLDTGALQAAFVQLDGNRVFDFTYSPQLDALYVCGQFTEIGNPWIEADRVARLNPVTAQPATFLGAAPSAPGLVQHYRGALFVAGGFTQLNGQLRRKLGALDADTGALLPFNAEIEGAGTGDLDALAVAGKYVYFGGSMQTVGGQFRRGAASVDVVTGAPSPWNPQVFGSPFAIAASRHYVVVGGEFSRAGGKATYNIAVFPIQATP